MNQISSNKRIAKNTIFLYFRTLITLATSLFTSRLVLQALGATDLGIYNVVGGVVTLMAFLQNAQTKATSRFITYELGVDGGSEESLKKVFSVCLTIHIIIAGAIVLLGETIGLWIVNEWTNIPAERQEAANWVYQFALITLVLHIIRVPYDSVIIAHENMSIYAYFSILEALLKLGIVVLLLRFAGDRLIFYALLLSVIALILFLLYQAYTRRNHPIYKFHLLWDAQYSKKILSFSGWTILGSSANTATQQGVSLLFNNFVGLVANAALGFANQVHSALVQFISSFSTAFNPQIVKLYAQRDFSSMHTLMFRASKFSFVLAYVLALPLIINMDFILELWLTDVPQYTSEFCKLILICTVIDATTGVYNTSITATGHIRNYQIGISISFFLDLLCAFILLKLGLHPAVVFGSRIVTRGVFNMFIGLHFCRKQLLFNVLNYTQTVLVPIFITLILTIPIGFVIGHNFDGWCKLLLSIITSIITVGLCTLTFIMTKSERNSILGMITKFLHK